ncbi:hypothetical protein A2400_00915 [candidate division WS6 bacterium RIFOXYB1_FULL_33_14]|uniref:HTH deoR-type domain-containing protein n=1 Tax=candidate division WS6 bacterium RIFOXYB1_FULL_33_14 TaxID=1817896 RepID=A0A1F4UHQ0_9BACT|nr:MAG: hypothetical protein A2400_00915 [candidate division WS6 bacterium RIFOXYB1_FULL_33_14]
MFKKLWYVISLLLGIFVFLKLFRSKEYLQEQVEHFKPLREPKVVTPTKKRNLRSLNSRQLKILKLLEKRKVLLPSDIYSLHPQVSTRTLRRDMTSLVELNIVKQEGSTKDTKYILIG